MHYLSVFQFLIPGIKTLEVQRVNPPSKQRLSARKKVCRPLEQVNKESLSFGTLVLLCSHSKSWVWDFKAKSGHAGLCLGFGKYSFVLRVTHRGNHKCSGVHAAAETECHMNSDSITGVMWQLRSYCKAWTAAGSIDVAITTVCHITPRQWMLAALLAHYRGLRLILSSVFIMGLFSLSNNNQPDVWLW